GEDVMLSSFLGGFAYALLGILFLAGTFTAGYVAARISPPPSPASAPASAAQPTTAPRNSTEADFAVFWEAWGIIKSEFIGKVPDDTAMTYAAISGVVNTLGDTHTHFDTPIAAAMLQSDLQGSFEGIGATVEQKSGQI